MLWVRLPSSDDVMSQTVESAATRVTTPSDTAASARPTRASTLPTQRTHAARSGLGPCALGRAWRTPGTPEPADAVASGRAEPPRPPVASAAHAPDPRKAAVAGGLTRRSRSSRPTGPS